MPRRVEGEGMPWRYRIQAEAKRGRVVDKEKASVGEAKVGSEAKSKYVRKEAWRNQGEAEARRDLVEAEAKPRRGGGKAEARPWRGRC